jgi:hypothetical protein
VYLNRYFEFVCRETGDEEKRETAWICETGGSFQFFLTANRSNEHAFSELAGYGDFALSEVESSVAS